ncbi:TPA: hypothetical protein N0F65_000925 [Lagenidium giganteum]|uniref:Uncharacterized protein n=1 Tax=Lagenidium giganteum TaxID=4803 RepID=A0AAV2YKC9_9STRA|nr:TPA: hypothetical protein N0F65_000925 [Lagenidium giganteum]
MWISGEALSQPTGYKAEWRFPSVLRRASQQSQFQPTHSKSATKARRSTRPAP